MLPGMDAPRWTALLAGWQSGTGPLYARLSAHLRGAVAGGQLAPGEALPAERALGTLLGVSRSTVVAAYDDLVAGDWITRRRGSGTRVAAGVPRQAHALELRSPVRGGPLRPGGAGDDLDLTVAVPLLSDAQRAELSGAVAGAFAESLYHPLGLPELRAELAALYTREGLPTTPEQVVVTSGAQQAIALLAGALLRPGDAALLETPTYFGAIDVFRAAGATLRGVPVTPQGAAPEEFAAAVRAHSPRLAFLTPTFQNPTGAVLPARARQRLAATIAGAGLPTIEDDTLIDLGFGEDAPPPRLACFAPQAPIFNVGSLSKLYWAGLRVGWLRLPGGEDARGLGRVVMQAKTLADFGGGLPSQHLALHLLRHLPRLRAERRAAVTPARDLLAGLLRAELPDWQFTLPQGGQFLWVELPTRSASSFIHSAARRGVRLFPGASMDVGDLPDAYLRLPFTLDPAHLPEAVARLRAAWHEHQLRGERLA